eukprot:2305689-Amphidinium_carterae.1
MVKWQRQAVLGLMLLVEAGTEAIVGDAEAFWLTVLQVVSRLPKAMGQGTWYPHVSVDVHHASKFYGALANQN